MDTAKDISPMLTKMYHIKKGLLSCEDYFRGSCDDEKDIAILERDDNRTRKLGVFSLKAITSDVKVNFPDGSYINRLTGKNVIISGGVLHCDGNPLILATDGV